MTHGIAQPGDRRLAAGRNPGLRQRLSARRDPKSPLPIFNGSNRPYISTYDWKTSWDGSFDPNAERYLNAAAFPAQPGNLLGNATRYNPTVRAFPSLNENVSLGKSFLFTERFRLDFRAEAFNMLNRVVFSAPSGNRLI